MITSHASRMKTELMHVNEVPDPLSLVNRGQRGKPCYLFCLPGIDGKKQWRLKAGNRSKTRTLASSISSLRNPLERQQANYLTTNMRAYNAAVLSVLLYGAETCLLAKNLSSRLNGFDSSDLRLDQSSAPIDEGVTSNTKMRVFTHQPSASCLAACRL